MFQQQSENIHKSEFWFCKTYKTLLRRFFASGRGPLRHVLPSKASNIKFYFKLCGILIRSTFRTLSGHNFQTIR